MAARGPRVRDAPPAQVRRDPVDGEPAPRRPGEVRRPGELHAGERAREGGHPRRHRRAREALLFHLRKNGQGRQGVQRDLRPDRHARDRRARGQGGRARLLRHARDHPFRVEADARAVQGLRRDAQVQPVPLAAHDGDRTRGTPARDPGANARDAPHRRVRDRGALGLQGRQAAQGPRVRAARLAPAAGRLAGGGVRPDRAAPRVPRARRRRGLRLHAEGRAEEPPGRLDADRLRLLRPHRRRPPHRGREGERPNRPAPLPAAHRRLRRDPDFPRRRARTVARLALAGRVLAREKQDSPVDLPGDPGGDRDPRPRGARGVAEAAQAPVQEARRLAAPRGADPRDGLQEGGGLLPGARLGEAPGGAGREQGAHAPEDGRGRRGGAAARPPEGPPRRRVPGLRDQRRGARGRPRAARQVLHARSRRRDRRLHLARQGHHDPPRATVRT